MANVAGKNERVRVNGDFSIIVPEGYSYSTDIEANMGALGNPRQLVFLKTEKNDIYIAELSEDEEFGFDEPFSAPQCFVVSAKEIGLRVDLSDSNIREKMRELVADLNVRSTEVFTIKETDDILVYCGAVPEEAVPQSFFAIVTSEYIYHGQIWINDVSTNEECNAIAKAWLETVECCCNGVDADDSDAKSLSDEAKKTPKAKTEENKNTVEETLNDATEQYRKAKRFFDHNVSKFVEVALLIIDINDDGAAERVVDTLQTIMTMDNNYYTTCRTLIFQLDKDCQCFLTENIPLDTVRKIAKEIADLNSNIVSDINGSFHWAKGLSFDNVEIGEIGGFIMPDELKQIEDFWAGKVQELEKKEEDDAYIAKHKIDAKDIEKHRAYEKAVSAVKKAETSASVKDARKTFVGLKGYLDSSEYIKECDILIPKLKKKEEIAAEEKRKREAEREAAKRAADPKVKREKVIEERNQKFAEFKNAVDQEAQKRVNELKIACDQVINSKKEEINQKQTEKQSLGVFRLSKKMALSGEIKELRNELDAVLNEFESKKQKIEQKAQAAKSGYSRSINAYIKKRFVINDGISESYREIVSEILKRIGNDKITVSMAWRMEEEWVFKYSIQVFSALMNQLVDAGILKKTKEKDVSYFSLADMKSARWEEVSEYADKPLPEPPSIDPIFS